MSLDTATVELLLQDLEQRLRHQAAWAGLPVFYVGLARDLAPLLDAAPDVSLILDRVCDMLDRLGDLPRFPPLPPLRLGHPGQRAVGQEGLG